MHQTEISQTDQGIFRRHKKAGLQQEVPAFLCADCQTAKLMTDKNNQPSFSLIRADLPERSRK